MLTDYEKTVGTCIKENKQVELKSEFVLVAWHGWEFLKVVNRNCDKCKFNKECKLFNTAHIYS